MVYDRIVYIQLYIVQFVKLTDLMMYAECYGDSNLDISKTLNL